MCFPAQVITILLTFFMCLGELAEESFGDGDPDDSRTLLLPENGVYG